MPENVTNRELIGYALVAAATLCSVIAAGIEFGSAKAFAALAGGLGTLAASFGYVSKSK